MAPVYMPMPQAYRRVPAAGVPRSMRVSPDSGNTVGVSPMMKARTQPVAPSERTIRVVGMPAVIAASAWDCIHCRAR